MNKGIFLLGLLFTASCMQKQEQTLPMEEEAQPASFGDYWYQNGAEITSYELKQARYGEIREGQAVMVFVTEPFSKSKQVKLDNYRSAGDDKVGVLKMNLTKKFLTGIYPYSMMLSTFVPLEGSHMLKSTTSIQEWCGQTFLQLNKQDSTGYRFQGNSYFESEGDVIGELPELISEDELWTQIRLNPEKLPEGDRLLLPSTFFIRLKHQPISGQRASMSLQSVESSAFSSQPHLRYDINYHDRNLSIFFQSSLPYTILGWEESYFDGSSTLTTSARRMRTIRSKYWNKNRTDDRHLRQKLNLPIP